MRRYEQFCGMAKALDVVGERWTLLIVRELMLGPRRYGELLDALGGIGTNLLARRLRELVAAGVVRKDGAYELTELGRGLQAPVLGLARWGLRFAVEGDGARRRPDWVVLGLRALVEAADTAGVRERLQLHVDGDVFHLVLDDGEATVGAGPIEGSEVSVLADTETFLAVGAGRLAPGDAVASGRMRVRGDPDRLAGLARALGLGTAAA